MGSLSVDGTGVSGYASEPSELVKPLQHHHRHLGRLMLTLPDSAGVRSVTQSLVSDYCSCSGGVESGGGGGGGQWQSLLPVPSLSVHLGRLMVVQTRTGARQPSLRHGVRQSTPEPSQLLKLLFHRDGHLRRPMITLPVPVSIAGRLCDLWLCLMQL